MFNRIYVEISNICNVQCSFCPVVDREQKILSVKNFESILKKIKGKTKEICLHLMGEPTAHPQFEEILNICENYNVKVQLTTNGLLIKRKEELILKHHCIRQINFSLQSFQDNFPHKPLKDYLEPIFSFTKQANEKRNDMYINYRLWNIGSEAQENEEIFKMIEKSFNLEINRKIQVENIKSKKIWNKLYLHFDSRFQWPSLELETISTKGRCHGLGSHIGIHADGSVVPCCLDKEAVLKLGNILEEDLDQILNSKMALEIKNGFDKGILTQELCQKCSFIQRFS